MRDGALHVSMKSGLEDRNNWVVHEVLVQVYEGVSMKSGLEDRNNCASRKQCDASVKASQ